MNDYVYQVKDLRTGNLDDIKGCRLKFYRDDAIDTRVIIDNVLQSEIGMQVARLLGLEETSNGLKVIFRWKGVENSEESSEPLKKTCPRWSIA